MARYRLDPDSKPRALRYLVLWDLQWHVVAHELLTVGTDASASIAATLTRLADDGWHAEASLAFGFVFLRRGAERRLLMLSSRDPHAQSAQSFSPFRS